MSEANPFGFCPGSMPLQLFEQWQNSGRTDEERRVGSVPVETERELKDLRMSGRGLPQKFISDLRAAGCQVT